MSLLGDVTSPTTAVHYVTMSLIYVLWAQRSTARCADNTRCTQTRVYSARGKYIVRHWTNREASLRHSSGWGIWSVSPQYRDLRTRELGLLANVSEMRWTLSSDVRDRRTPFLLTTGPVSRNAAFHTLILLASGGYLWYSARKRRWTAIIDPNSAYHRTVCAFQYPLSFFYFSYVQLLKQNDLTITIHHLKFRQLTYHTPHNKIVMIVYYVEY